MAPCRIISIPGLVPYAEALAWQYEMVRRRQAGDVPDTLLLLEHPPTITLGRRTQREDLLTPPERLRAQGIDVVEVDRGGEITYHAPGQLVGYPILDLREHGQDLHRYLRDLEETLIQALAELRGFGGADAGADGGVGGGRQDRGHWDQSVALGLHARVRAQHHAGPGPDAAGLRAVRGPGQGRDVAGGTAARRAWTRAEVEDAVVRGLRKRVWGDADAGTAGYTAPMKVRVTMEMAGRTVDETVTGTDADDVLSQAKARVARELGWKGLFLNAMPTLTFAQEAVRRYNAASGTHYDVPQSADDFLKLGQDLGYFTILPD